jgi:hypothetical protein
MYSYLKFFSLIFISLILTVGAFNWVIDPFGVYQVIKIQGMNTEKTQVMVGGGRAIKAMGLLEQEYGAAILGTSRANVGIRPNHEVFIPLNGAYNAALNGSNLYEIEKVLDFILSEKKSIQVIVFSLDFLTFSSRRRVNADFEQSLFSEQYFLQQLSRTFSLDGIYYSIQTITDNLNQKKANFHQHYTKQGLAKQIFPLPHHQLFVNILSRNFFVNKNTYAGFCYSEDRLNRFKRLIAKARAQGVMIKFFISPVHAWQLEAIRIMGLFPTFEQWKRDLTAILAQDAVAHPKQAIYPLWDFTGYNSVTTEAIPEASEQTMQWYWESSHFKKTLGDIVLDQLFDYPSTKRKRPDDFGVLINRDNIEQHLLKIRQARQRYHDSHPNDIAKLEALAAKKRRKVDLPCPPF